MRDLFSSKLWVRAGAVYLVVAIFFAGIPSSVFAAHIVDIKVNDSDGPVMVSGEEFVYSWTSTEATACTLTSPTGVSGISLAGVGAPIPSEHPWYPTTATSTTLTINCTNGTSTVSDLVVIHRGTVPPPPPPPPICPLPTITSSLALTATLNQEFSYTITATTTGITSTTTRFSIATSTLPQGLS